MLPAFGHRLLFPIFLITLFMSISRGVSVWSWHSENLATVLGVGVGVDLVGVMEENKVQGCVFTLEQKSSGDSSPNTRVPEIWSY